MPATITQHPSDTEKTIEDKVRNLPANQGKNDNAIWQLVDAEITQSVSDGKIIRNTNRNNKYGSK